VKKADLYLLQRNRDECVIALESHMTAFLPNGHEAEVVAQNPDEIPSVNWSQAGQRADLEVSGVSQRSLSAWLPFP